MIKRMVEKVGIYYYILPTYSQGKKIIWDGIDKAGLPFLEHFPKELIQGKPNISEMKIKLKNKSLFQIIGSDRIDALMGTNPIGCIFSEYSLQNPQAWDMIRPILAENGGWAVFVFTPRGVNHGFNILQLAKENKNWFSEVLTVEDTNAITRTVLEEEKRQMPTDLFEQEYFCNFIDGAGALFKRIDNNLWNGNLTVKPYGNYQIGVDLAKYQDFTVITIVDLATWKVAEQIRFNQIDWNLQKARIEAEARKWNDARVIIDSTGVGDPIFEDLERAGLDIEGFKFNEMNRKQLLDNLSIKLEQDLIKIPDNEILINELKSMKYELSERGKLKMKVPDGLHDDCLFSLALAFYGLEDKQNYNDINRDKDYYRDDYKVEKYDTEVYVDDV